MYRLMLTLAASALLTSTTHASLTPPVSSTTFGNYPPVEKSSQTVTRALATAAAKTNSEFVLTHRTEVLLDGKPCKYEEVPGHASIERMELAADKKTVVRIQFRSRK
jgi:hypothetical protein